MAYPVFIFGYCDWDVYDGGHLMDVMKNRWVIGTSAPAVGEPHLSAGAQGRVSKGARRGAAPVVALLRLLVGALLGGTDVGHPPNCLGSVWCRPKE